MMSSYVHFAKQIKKTCILYFEGANLFPRRKCFEGSSGVGVEQGRRREPWRERKERGDERKKKLLYLDYKF
jgi:hypothetical protein